MATVAELYQQVLGRAPDPEGLAFWTKYAGSSVDPEEANAFVAAAKAEIAANQAAQASQSNITPTQVADFLKANPGLSDTQIAAAMDKYGVSPDVVAQATGLSTADVTARYQAAGGTGMMAGLTKQSPPPPPPIPSGGTATTTQPAAAPITGNAGQYGYQNGAPVLNATVAKSLLGNEFEKKIDIGENNQLGWGTNSKYQGQILTGAGLYGVRGTSEEVQKILAAGETFKQLQAQGKVISSTDPETGAVTYRIQSGIDPESGSPAYTDARNLFNTATREDEFNADDNIRKWQDYSAKLTDAAQKLGINPNQPMTNILNEVNTKDNRIAVVGRTQYWDPNQTGGIGGQGGPQHAAVVYQQSGDKLIPASTVETFNFQDPNTTKGFFGDIVSGIGDILSVPPITAALAAFGAPYLAGTLTSQFGLSDVAAKAISSSLIAGTTTGVITGDAEKALIAALMAGSGSYAVNSGLAGDALDKLGLGDYKETFGVLNTDQVAKLDEVKKSFGIPTTSTTTTTGTTTGTPTVPSMFNEAVDTAVTGGQQPGTFGQVGTGGFGTALPSVSDLTQSLVNAGFSPGTAANLAGATLAGVGAAGLGAASTEIGRAHV